MTNREVARTFNKLAKVMELHGENPFKIKSYANAYNTLRRLPQEVFDLSKVELLKLNGVGKNIADKIEELKTTGNIAVLQKYIDQTPPGIVDLLDLKGLGPKKILAVWKELGIESAGELLYACQENRLIELKGFGAKTQETLEGQLVYFLDGRGKYLYGHIESEANELLDYIKAAFPQDSFDFINDVRRQMPVVGGIEILGTVDETLIMNALRSHTDVEISEDAGTFKGTKFAYEAVSRENYFQRRFEGSCSEEFWETWKGIYGEKQIHQTDDDLFEELGISFIPAESREMSATIKMAGDKAIHLITEDEIKGVVHNHSTYSDGANTLKEMAEACRSAGYEYLVISDHSKSAFYANGLNEDRVYQQFTEIDALNATYSDFKIFKGIESDILYDGMLDYNDDVLSDFEVIIASVHSNLKMDQVKATDRLITAVNNKYTRILGHPTGRLLLSREGYPIDHMAVIDACAENNVVIELNANPYRLDLDWTWIPYALEKGVKIAINPDAHSIKGIMDIRFGISAARKALLRPDQCLNTLSRQEFERWVSKK